MIFRDNPWGLFFSLVSSAAVMLLLFWVYRQLRSSAVEQVRAAAGHRTGVPVSAFVAGCGLAIALAILLQLTLKGDTAKQAIHLATRQYGSEYKYFVSGINWSGNGIHAQLVAYNDHESKKVVVEWTK